MTRRRIVSLLDYILAANPRYTRPEHMAPLAEVFERAKRGPVRVVCSAPPRHGKTAVVKSGCAWVLRDDPSRRLIYASYAQRFAEKRSREIRAEYSRTGGKMADDARARSDWRTGVYEGGTWATSVGGSVTGEGGDVIVVDDPHKGRAEAESQLERDKVYEWFRDDLGTRAEPGASIIVVQTRWHPDDLAGRLLGEGWEYVSLPAINEAGEALWPERYGVDALNEIRESIGEYSWASLYMQSPRPRGGAVFQGVRFYDALPTGPIRIGKGTDLAYTARTRADKSAAVVILEIEGLYYVADVRTARVKVPDFLAVLSTVDASYPGPWHWFASTTERGLADLATATAGVRLISELAREDKFFRAQPFAAAWNASKVLLPRHAPWLDAYVAELCGFTGVGDRHDDMVDASASAFVSIAPGTRSVDNVSMDDFELFRSMSPRARGGALDPRPGQTGHDFSAFGAPTQIGGGMSITHLVSGGRGSGRSGF